MNSIWYGWNNLLIGIFSNNKHNNHYGVIMGFIVLILMFSRSSISSKNQCIFYNTFFHMYFWGMYMSCENIIWYTKWDLIYEKLVLCRNLQKKTATVFSSKSTSSCFLSTSSIKLSGLSLFSISHWSISSCFLKSPIIQIK